MWFYMKVWPLYIWGYGFDGVCLNLKEPGSEGICIPVYENALKF